MNKINYINREQGIGPRLQTISFLRRKDPKRGREEPVLVTKY